MVIAGRVCVFLIIIAVGFIAAKTNVITPQVRPKLSALLLNICAPMQVLAAYSTDYSPSLVKNMLMVLAAGLVFIGLFGFLGKFRFKKGRSDERQRIMWYCSTFFNSGFMGIPVLQSVFGEEGVIYASMFMMAFNVYAWTLGLHIAQGGRGFQIKNLLQPTLIACVVGIVMFAFKIKLPSLLLDACNTVGNMTTPLSMLITGAILSELKLQELKDKDLYILSADRLLLQPLVTWGVLALIGVPVVVLQASVLMMGMPVAAYAVLFGTLYNMDPNFAGKAVAFTTVASMATLPVFMLLMG